MSTPEVAGRLEVSPRTLEDWRQNGKGPPYTRVGRAVRYDEDKVAAWVKAQGVEPEGDADEQTG